MLFSSIRTRISNSDRQGAAAATFAGNYGDEGDRQTSHFAEVVRNRFCLAALLGAQTGICAHYIDQRNHRPLPLLSANFIARRALR